MENMLRRFVLLCGGDYQQAVSLNHLYYETCEHGGENWVYEYITNLDTIAQKLCILPSSQAREALLASLLELRAKGFIGLLHETLPGILQGHQEFVCMVSPRMIDHRIAQIEEEEEKIERHNKRAIKLGQPGTLTIEDWMYTLHMFRWTCAYCSEGYDVLEHVIPLNFFPSGTTFENCVPACASCNNLKGPYHPDRLPMRIRNEMGDKIDQVRDLLFQWKTRRGTSNKGTRA